MRQVLSAPKYKPNPRQKEFHQSPAKFRAFIGGFGSGKSVAGAIEAWKHIGLYPGSFGIIGRLEFKALTQSSMKTFFQWGPPAGWTYNKQEGKLYVPFPNGKVSEVLFWHFDNPDPLRSMEFDWFWIDEAHEVPEDTFLMLQGRLRGAVGPHRGWVTSNPNGRDYLWRWFVDQSTLSPEHRKNYHGIIAKSEDNIANLPEGYLEGLRAVYPEEWVRRFLNAEFDVFAGQIYHELTDGVHFIDPYPIPSTWRRIFGMDVGYTNPTVFLFGALDPDGRLIIYDEIYKTGAEPPEIAQEIFKRDPVNPRIFPTWIDPSAAQKTAASKRSVLQQYRESGLRVVPANNAVWAGIMAVKQRLMLASDGFPRLMIFRNCVNLIRELTAYRWKETKNEDVNSPEVPLDKDDHGPDALRYMVMSLPLTEAGDLRRTELYGSQQPPKRTVRSKVAGY